MNQTEADLTTAILDYAHLRHWRIAHVRPARTEDGWRTPYEGDDGLPDLILARAGRVILAELKSDTGKKPTLDQQAWLDAAGPNGYLWRPKDWDAIMKVLT